MKLWILSDLHVDKYSNSDFVIESHPECDVIILAGDLCNGDFYPVKWLADNFSDEERRKMLYVTGNHEAWGRGRGLHKVDGFAQKLAEKVGIIPLNRRVIEINGQRFVGAPLWANCDPRHDDWLRREPRGDFLEIPKFSPAAMRAEHERDLAWLHENVREGDVVITHHAPAYEGLKAEMQHAVQYHWMKSFYCTRLEPFIEERRPKMWVHGHTHKTDEYRVGDTRVVTNARGFGWHFQHDYVVELDDFVPKPKGF